MYVWCGLTGRAQLWIIPAHSMSFESRCNILEVLFRKASPLRTAQWSLVVHDETGGSADGSLNEYGLFGLATLGWTRLLQGSAHTHGLIPGVPPHGLLVGSFGRHVGTDAIGVGPNLRTHNRKQYTNIMLKDLGRAVKSYCPIAGKTGTGAVGGRNKNEHSQSPSRSPGHLVTVDSKPHTTPHKSVSNLKVWNSESALQKETQRRRRRKEITHGLHHPLVIPSKI